jgi:hypothetical protein
MSQNVANFCPLTIIRYYETWRYDLQSWKYSLVMRFSPFFDFVFVVAKTTMLVTSNAPNYILSKDTSTKLGDTISFSSQCKKWSNIGFNKL